MRKLFSFVVLLLLLVGFPAASYYYMKDGFDYRRRAIEAQGDYGKMPALASLHRLRGTLPPSTQGAMLVAGWLDLSQQEAAYTYGHMLDSLFQQFKDSPNLYFTTFSSADSLALANWCQQHHLPDHPMLSILATDSSQFVATARDFKLPAQPGQTPLVALVDSSLTIRSFYQLDQRAQTIGLVQLISLIIPLPPKGDILLAPKKEL